MYSFTTDEAFKNTITVRVDPIIENVTRDAEESCVFDVWGDPEEA